MRVITVTIELDDTHEDLPPRITEVKVNGEVEPIKDLGPHFSYWPILVDEDKEYSIELHQCI